MNTPKRPIQAGDLVSHKTHGWKDTVQSVFISNLVGYASFANTTSNLHDLELITPMAVLAPESVLHGLPGPDLGNEQAAAQIERVALLMEEMAETIHVIGKILRHGFNSYNPYTEEKNKTLLEKELSHVSLALSLLIANGDIDPLALTEYQSLKQQSVKRFMHYKHKGL